MEPGIIVALITSAGAILVSLIGGVFGVINNNEIRKLKKRLQGAFNRIQYLLNGIDILIKQITEKHHDEPDWRPEQMWLEKENNE